MKLILGFCLIGLTVGISLAQNLHNVAGNGTQGNSGDGSIATNAQLVPTGVALDPFGNMYIADVSASVIRRVDAITHIITTVAGTGTAGYNGDSIPAISAQLNHPLNVSLDTVGNLYISDSQNHRVRKITAQGGQITPACIITTAAGDGTYVLGPSTDGDGGPAINAQLHYPVGIVVDKAGNLYIGDIGHHALRKVNTAGIISTISGDPNHYLGGHSGDNGQAQFALLAGPHAFALDTAGNLYFADSGNNRVRKITACGGQITKTCTITAFAGPVNGTLNGFSGDAGLAVNARLNLPMGVAADSGGNIYISDQYNARIRKVDTSGIITTIAGTGSFTLYNYSGNGVAPNMANLQPFQLTVDTCPNFPNLYFADQVNHVIGRITYGTVPIFNPSITSTNPVCAGKNITAAGQYSGSTPPDNHSWQLQSCTSAGVTTSAYDSGILNFPGAPSGAFTFPNTSNLACNQYYLITFTVKKNCPEPVTTKVTKIIYINCNPSPAITGNTTICHGRSTTLCANYPNNSQYTVEWIYHAGTVVIDVDAQCITVSPTANTTYNMSVTDNVTGCKSTKNVAVTVVKADPEFTYQTNYNSPNTYFTVTATPIAPYTNGVAGFGDLWIIEQLDSAGNPIPSTNTGTGNPGNPNCWWIYPAVNAFNGFDGTKSSGINNVTCSSPSPGRFLNGGTYRITHGIWNNYCPWSQTSHTITVTGNRNTGNFTSVERKSNVNVPDYSYLKPASRSNQIRRP